MGVLNPMRAIKFEGKNRREEGTTRLVQKLESKCVRNNIYIYIRVEDTYPAIRAIEASHTIRLEKMSCNEILTFELTAGWSQFIFP